MLVCIGLYANGGFCDGSFSILQITFSVLILSVNKMISDDAPMNAGGDDSDLDDYDNVNISAPPNDHDKSSSDEEEDYDRFTSLSYAACKGVANKRKSQLEALFGGQQVNVKKTDTAKKDTSKLPPPKVVIKPPSIKKSYQDDILKPKESIHSPEHHLRLDIATVKQQGWFASLVTLKLF